MIGALLVFVRIRFVEAALLGVIGCSRRVEPLIHAEATDAAADSATDASDANNDIARTVPRIALSCVATDALWARSKTELIRVETNGATIRLPSPGGLAAAPDWSAGGDWVAWAERGKVNTWSLRDQRDGPSFVLANSEFPSLLVVGADRVACTNDGPFCEKPDLPSCPASDWIAIGDLIASRERHLSHPLPLDVRALAIGGGRLAVAHDFRSVTDAAISTADITKTAPSYSAERVARPTEMMVLHAPLAIDTNATYFVDVDAIRAVDHTAPFSVRVVQALKGRKVLSLNANAGRLVAVVYEGLKRSVLGFEGARSTTIAVGSEVETAFAGDRITWCAGPDISSAEWTR